MALKKKIIIFIIVTLLSIMLLEIMLPSVSFILKSGIITNSLSANIKSWDVSANQDGSITATFDKNTRTLTISGSGAMKNYTGSYTDVPWLSYNSEIYKVNISEGITNISSYSFYECRNIRSITIPNSVAKIGNKSFYKCDNLSNIILGSGLKEIGTEAFLNCSNLRNIVIPDSVQLIGQLDNEIYGKYQFDVFRGCTKLENISVGKGNKNYSALDGVLFNKDKTKLVSYPEAKKTSEYTIPSSVKEIGAYSIYNVNNVTQINVPSEVTSMEDGAFRGCINLKNINVPAGVIKLGSDVFDDCTKLENITVDGNNLKYSSMDGVLFNKDKTSILSYPIGKRNTTYTIPSSVTTIEDGAFMNCINLTNIQIPNSVVDIEWFAFSGCKGLTEITIPDSVKKMGSIIFDMRFGYIFEDCENLKTIKLPAKLDTFYSEYAFQNCRSLEEIIIPEGTKYIGDSAFVGCYNLENIEFPESVISIHTRAFQWCSSLKSIQIPNIDPIIPEDSFYETNLEILDIPEGITTIRSGAFGKCRNLKQINIPDTIANIEERAFEEACLTVKVETNSSENYEIELPEIIKRTMNLNDVLYSQNGIYATNCTLDGDKIIANKDMLEQGKVKLKVRSGALMNLEVLWGSNDFQDTIKPEVQQISISGGGKVWKVGDKITIDVRFNEYVKGIPPVLKVKFGNLTEKIAETPINEWGSGSSLRYYYTVQEGDNGILDIISIIGNEMTDWSGNDFTSIDDFSNQQDIIYYPYGVIFANTMSVEEGIIKEEYYITNKEELKNIQELVASGTYDFGTSTIYLENDIDLECNEDEQWIPIGTIYNPFKGIFEGNGHRITGLYINTTENYQGLIGYNSGKIRNVSVDDSYIYSTGNYIGGITGCNYGRAIIENCYNNSQVTGKYYVGGISGGNNNPYTGEIEITNCYNSGEVKGYSSTRRNCRKNVVE